MPGGKFVNPIPDMQSPYSQPQAGRWLKGNLHAHTTESDGKLTPPELVQAYTERGYDFLVISDHDRVTAHPRYDPARFLVISGNEITARGPHILHVGATSVVEPLADRGSVLEEAARGGGIRILNHPNWEKDFGHWSMEKVLKLPTLYHGIEVFNGVVLRHAGYPFATDIWDQLLSRGIRIWGYANDDTHDWEDIGNGWNVVNADALEREPILSALETGRFYASTGVALTTLCTEGNRVRIVSSNGSVCIPVVDWGVELGRFRGRSWEFDLDTLVEGKRATYIRFEIHGDARTAAWTQPIWIK